ncbi:hypothetical protein K502DRAFT_321390 [Neoconidiobolus thromboides FSU 785]|nr:hypothetical protein K502DRAFT_321390 [Neoconidiobolus thromboides FSU 785]
MTWLDHESLVCVVDDELITITLPKDLKDIDVKEFETSTLYKFKELVDISNIQYNIKKDKMIFSAKNKVNTNSHRFGDDGILFDKLFVRHWDQFILPNQYQQLYSLDINKNDKIDNKKGINKWEVKGSPKNLLKYTDLESPVLPFGDNNDYDISPDGKWLVFTSKISGNEKATTTTQGIYLLQLDSTSFRNTPKPLNKPFTGAASFPKFSKDGKKIAWLQMKNNIYESDKNHIHWYDISTQQVNKVDLSYWDRSPNSLLWNDESNKFIVTANDIGINKLYIIDIKSNKVRRMNKYDSVSEVQLLKEDILLLKLSSFQQPYEFYTMEIDNYYKLIQQSNIHKDLLKPYELQEQQSFFFEGKNNKKVHGFIIPPKEHRYWRKYPLAFLIHGGPQGAWLNQWSYRWNPQVFAQQGYATVMINPTGSTGYGQNFTDAIKGDWGGAPFEDLMLGLNYVLENYNYIDGSRACALGASYGGYMINWLNGHTDRFRCLVNHDGMFDAVSAYYSTDELYFNEHDFAGKPWENPETYTKFSPSSYVWKWSTPTLIIHSQKDYRLTIDQGLSAFTALQRRGVPSRLLYFPDENHWVLKPQNSLRWHKEIFSWINRYARPYLMSNENIHNKKSESDMALKVERNSGDNNDICINADIDCDENFNDRFSSKKQTVFKVQKED